MNRIKSFAIITVLLSIAAFGTPVSAQIPLHVSSTVSTDLFSNSWPGYDLTLLYAKSFGLRYSLIPDISFVSTDELNTTLKIIEVDGDFKLPMFMKTLDYRSFYGNNKTLFDFLTAYVAFGLGDMELELAAEEYTADSSALKQSDLTEVLKARTVALAIGLYGGERFLVTDLRLMYALGSIEKSEVTGKEYQFHLWMLVLGIGVFF